MSSHGPTGFRRSASPASIQSAGASPNNFADYVTFWKHNGYWLFDSPAVITDIARENNIDLAETMLFFYEVHELQFNSGVWTPFERQVLFVGECVSS